MIKDSGKRKEFESGAVRDIQDGKGRFDLMPLGVIGDYLYSDGKVLLLINNFIETGKIDHLSNALKFFTADQYQGSMSMLLLEVAKHYEDGAEKYGERNWEKGIPLHSYLDSAVRHYIKHIGNWTDEPHDRAFVWNILGAMWTVVNKPDLCDLPIFQTEG